MKVTKVRNKWVPLLTTSTNFSDLPPDSCCLSLLIIHAVCLSLQPEKQEKGFCSMFGVGLKCFLSLCAPRVTESTADGEQDKRTRGWSFCLLLRGRDTDILPGKRDTFNPPSPRVFFSSRPYCPLGALRFKTHFESKMRCQNWTKISLESLRMLSGSRRAAD